MCTSKNLSSFFIGYENTEMFKWPISAANICGLTSILDSVISFNPLRDVYAPHWISNQSKVINEQGLWTVHLLPLSQNLGLAQDFPFLNKENLSFCVNSLWSGLQNASSTIDTLISKNSFDESSCRLQCTQQGPSGQGSWITHHKWQCYELNYRAQLFFLSILL